MNWYRVSPLNFVAFVLLFYCIMGFFENGADDLSAFTGIFLPAFGIVLLFDIVMQYLLRNKRRAIWISQVILIITIALLFYLAARWLEANPIS